MIAKHVPMRSLAKSDFAELVEYITDEQGKTERLGPVTATHCAAATLQAVIGEVLATQRQNTRGAGDKTYHLLVSFRPGEHPSADTLKVIEERICAGLGYGEHQRVSAVHHDTDNLHLHIAINKIHPERHTMHEPFQSYRTLAELCAVLERDCGLERDNHQSRRSVAEGRAADMERHAGVESLVGWVRRESLEEMRGAQSWTELHQVMRKNGLELRERGNGLVVEAADGTRVKASTIARELSKPGLEARLGPFEPSPDRLAEPKMRRQYEKPPIGLRVNTVELYARYKAEQQTLTAARADSLAKARRRKDRAVDGAKRANRLRRATITVVDSKGVGKKALYSQASTALRDQLAEIHKEYAKEREKLSQGFKRRAWADWLKQEALQGNADALAALRGREAAQGLKGNTIAGQGATKSERAHVQDNITKKGTIIFRIGQSAVRDDGDKLQVSRDATREGVQAALRLAMERYGSQITVNGTPAFKAQIIRAAVDSQLPITFADPALELRRQQLLSKEKAHERAARTERGRTDRRRLGGAGSSAAADDNRARTGAGAGRGGSDGRGGAGMDAPAHVGRKPNVGRIGRVPPPQSQHRLRGMSELSVVRIVGGGEVLLPRDVPRHVEQQRAQSDHALRRDAVGVGRLKPAQQAAADEYLAEREDKPLKYFDIPKNSLYNKNARGFSFAGLRHVEGRTLALLRRDDADAVMVLPIDQATARRLSRVAVGDPVTVTPRGSIQTSKGRSR
ncbi:TraI protein of DNA transfer system (plasmid) [Aromatoleum aromaticum EbN1]|uniref:TraI protein of DNA transfer system n=1 Tax=Aromatoleum aromaticum (strain DSM 19018 / LMG 30748 / EbN1) TaxID=76114 RepID=Q5NWI9_AROAE|nr:TraI/MobA(P) family conjugative relaxase [Aromatoleum aromaticum]CAI10575.1 TraI protein of DNA transfer system [Aromatoleum aromaticum EbN1]